MTHYRLGHAEEAKKWLDKADQWTDKVFAENQPAGFPQWARRVLMKLYRAEAEALINGRADSARAQQLADSAHKHAHEGYYQKALAEWSEAITLRPDEAIFWVLRAQAELSDRQVDAYRRHCAEMLRRSGPVQNIAPRVCFLVCEACTFAPDAVADWPTLLALADKAVEMRPADRQSPLIRGAVLYRAGRLEEAVEPLTASHRMSEDISSPYVTLDDARACAFLAMAHHRLGHREEARRWFDEMVEQMDAAIAEHRSGKVSFYWNIRAPMKLLRPEAAKVLGISEKPAGQDQKPQPSK